MTYTPPEGAIEILHVDADICAVHKPPGLLSVPGRGADKADCLPARLTQYGPLFIVHRLDMATSGIMLLARTEAAHRHLSRQFEARRVTKRYIAHVEGHLREDRGTIDFPLITDWPNRPRQKVCKETGKPSLTTWHVIDRREAVTVLHLTPITGRSHQLRVHMAAMGHPILGDQLYGNPALSNRLMLHAERLVVQHPETGKDIEIVCPASFD